MLSRVKARMLLSECRGDEIWSPQTCRRKGVPVEWIDELADTYESGFKTDRDTIYEDGQLTNQYHGVWDRNLAIRIAEFLGVNAEAVIAYALGREAEVLALQEAVDEL